MRDETKRLIDYLMPYLPWPAAARLNEYLSDADQKLAAFEEAAMRNQIKSAVEEEMRTKGNAHEYGEDRITPRALVPGGSNIPRY